MAYILWKTGVWMLLDIPILGALRLIGLLPTLPPPWFIFVTNLLGVTALGFINGELSLRWDHK